MGKQSPETLSMLQRHFKHTAIHTSVLLEGYTHLRRVNEFEILMIIKIN